LSMRRICRSNQFQIAVDAFATEYKSDGLKEVTTMEKQIDLLICPGETIEDVLKDRNMTVTELAELTGCSEAFINRVIAGSDRITDDFAETLERTFGVSKSFWINLQNHYDEEHRNLH